MSWLYCYWATLQQRLRGEEGMSTAELLGNAAIAIAALVFLWTALRAAGVDIINYIKDTVTSQ